MQRFFLNNCGAHWPLALFVSEWYGKVLRTLPYHSLTCFMSVQSLIKVFYGRALKKAHTLVVDAFDFGGGILRAVGRGPA